MPLTVSFIAAVRLIRLLGVCQPFPRPIPFDVICAILQWIDLKTAKAATLVSRDFYSLWPRWPCRIPVENRTLEMAVNFLLGNAGALIRELTITMSHDAPVSDHVIQALVMAISRCSNLKRLCMFLSYHRLEFGTALGRLESFASNLESYGSTLEGAEGASFLSLHRCLKSLDMLSGFDDDFHATIPIQLPAPLPRLRKVAAGTVAYLSVLRDSPVTEVVVWLEARDRPSLALSYICSSSVPLENLTLYSQELSEDQALGWYDMVTHLPSLKHLCVGEDYPEVYDRRVAVITALPRLESLALEWDVKPGSQGTPWSVPPSLNQCKALRHLELTVYDHGYRAGKRKYGREISTENWIVINYVYP